MDCNRHNYVYGFVINYMTKSEIKKAIGKKKKYKILYKSFGDYFNTIIVDTTSNKDIYFNEDHLIYNTGYSRDTIRYENIILVYSIKKKLDAEITHGSDPELFFERDGIMIPSTSVILQDTSLVTRDGFQVELHPIENRCRQVCASRIKDCIRHAKNYADTVGAKLSFNLSYTVNEDVWNRTDDTTKRFGCHPTMNVYEPLMERSDGLNEKFRAGGGHLHVGGLTPKEKKDLPTIVTLFDIVVGNTLVLLDRDPANVTRRINYGRAGEYRPKKYGVEYRVPSNFWLRHYVLFSLANALVRNAMTHYRNGDAKKVIRSVNLDNIRTAINTNDFDLALSNFKDYTKFLETTKIPYNCGISYLNYNKFIKWVMLSKPLSKLNIDTDKKITNHWVHLMPTMDEGFEVFIKKIKN